MPGLATEVLALIGRDLLAARLVREVNVTAPAAGSDISVKVPGGIVWELLSARASFTASVAVANRIPSLLIQDADGGELFRAPSGLTVTAGQTAILQWARLAGYQTATSPTLAYIPKEATTLAPSWRIITSTTGIDAADTYTAVNLIVREWDETGIVQESLELFRGYEEYFDTGYRDEGDA